MGFNRAQNTANNLGDVFDFLGLICVWFFGDLNYSKMANLGSRTYSKTCWNIFGTSEKLKFGNETLVL